MHTALIMPSPTIEPPLSSSTAFLQFELPAVAAAAAADAEAVKGDVRSSGCAARWETTRSAKMSACAERSRRSVEVVTGDVDRIPWASICSVSARKKAVAGSAWTQSCCRFSSERCCSSRVMDLSSRSLEFPMAIPAEMTGNCKRGDGFSGDASGVLASADHEPCTKQTPSR